MRTRLGFWAQQRYRAVLELRGDPVQELLRPDLACGGAVAVRAVGAAGGAEVVHAHGLAANAHQALPTGRVVPPFVMAAAADPGRLNTGGVARAHEGHRSRGKYGPGRPPEERHGMSRVGFRCFGYSARRRCRGSLRLPAVPRPAPSRAGSGGSPRVTPPGANRAPPPSPPRIALLSRARPRADARPRRAHGGAPALPVAAPQPCVTIGIPVPGQGRGDVRAGIV